MAPKQRRSRSAPAHVVASTATPTSPAVQVVSTPSLGARLDRLQTCPTNRVLARTLDGTHVGLAGLGDRLYRLTFPGFFRVGYALDSWWIRFATEEEQRDTGRWWADAPFQPRCMIFPNGEIADANHCIGKEGDTVTVLHMQAAYDDLEEVPCMDLSGVATPRTPRP